MSEDLHSRTTAADRYIEAYVRFHRRANRERGTADPRAHTPDHDLTPAHEMAAAPIRATSTDKSEAATLANEDADAQKVLQGSHRPEPVDWDDKLTHAALAELKDDLYRNLDTLDGKASGLLSYCGLVLAGSAILLDRGGNTGSVTIIAIVALTAALSAFLGVFVIFVKWTPSSKLERDHTYDACSQYFGVRRRRTRLYLVSWLTIVVSTAAFILYLVVSLATGNPMRMDAAGAPAEQRGAAAAPQEPPAEPAPDTAAD